MQFIEKIREPIEIFLEQHKKAFLVSVMIAVTVLNIAIILLPLGLSLYKTGGEAAILHREIQDVRHDKTIEDRIRGALEDTKRLLAEREKALAIGDISLYLESLSRIAHNLDVKIVSVKPFKKMSGAQQEDEKEAGHYQYALFEIAANSAYHSFGEFLSKLENNAAFIKVTDIRIQTNPEDAKDHKITLRIQMVQKGEAKSS